MSLNPISDQTEQDIVSVMQRSSNAPSDPHPRSHYIAGVQLMVARYNKAVASGKSPEEVAALVARECSDAFFSRGYGKDRRVTEIAGRAQWSAEFVKEVEEGINREEEKYRAGEKITHRDAYFTSRAKAGKGRGFEAWRGSSE